MQRSAAFVFVAALHLGAASAQEKALDRVSEGPNHLRPVRRDYPIKGLRATDFYEQRLYDIFDVRRIEAAGPADVAVLIVQPPFDAESCLTLIDHGIRGGELTYRTVDRSIWYAMPENRADERNLVPRGTADGLAVHGVQTLVRPLDATRTRRVLRLWDRMLRGVPQNRPGSRPLVEDDVRYTFRLHRERLYGEAGGSSAGEASAFVRVGEALIAISQGRPSGRKRALRELDRACEALERRLEGTPSPRP